MQEGEQRPIGRMNTHAIGVRATPAPTTPNVAIGVATNAVGKARREVGELLATGNAGSRTVDVKYGDVGRVRAIGRAGVDHVKFFEVRRKAKAIRSANFAFGDHRQFTGLTVDAIDPRRQFKFRFVAFIRAEDAVARIGEPNGTIGVNGCIIRRVEFFAVKTIGENSPRTVILTATNAASVMLHGD